MLGKYKFPRMAAALLLALSLCGCGKTGESTSEIPGGSGVSDNSSDIGSSGAEKTITPIEEDFYRTNYIPPTQWEGMKEIINADSGELSVTTLPIVYIECKEEIGRDIMSECTISIDSKNAEDFPSFKTAAAEIRGRGHSTWEWPKKPYKLKLKEKDSLLGMTASKNWALIANYADESLIRNNAAFAMARALGSFDFTPECVPVDLVLNGVYQGVYTLGELIEVKKSRLELDEREDSPNTGYLLEVGGAEPEFDDEGTYFNLPSGCATNILIKAPEDEKLKQENYDYIYEYMCRADKAITTLSDYDTYIDVGSFIDWFLLHELTYNLDSCFHRSCFLTKNRGEKLKMGPVWDFDLAFGNMYMDNPEYDDFATLGSSNSASYIGVNWFNYLLSDNTFREKARVRWKEVRDALVKAGLDETELQWDRIGDSAKLNFRVWDTLGIANGYQPLSMGALNTYPEQAQYVKRFIKSRAEWLDNNL